MNLRVQYQPALLSLLAALGLSGCFVAQKVLALVGDTDADADVQEETTDDPTAGGDSPVPVNSAVSAAPTGLDRYRRWLPVHALMAEGVAGGNGVGENDAIAFTRLNHVGLTQDAGASWVFAKHENGGIRAAAGFSGGPYVVVGTGGYISRTMDGRAWEELPRRISDELIGVVATGVGFVAIGRKGSFVQVAKEGSDAAHGWFPDGFKPISIADHQGTLIASAGKKAYSSADGRTWTAMESAPSGATAKGFMTSAGLCTLGKVGAKKGVVCTVQGKAHGIAPQVFGVESKGVVSLSVDAGATWTTAALGFSGANAMFGSAAGPYFAIGSGGTISISKDGGASWNEQGWEETAVLRAGLVDGSTVIVVGDGGTIVVSKDGGSKWDYAESPMGGKLSVVTKVGDKFVVGDGRSAISSTDGMSWLEELEQIPEVPDSGDCEGAPAPGVRCDYWSSRTTPAGLPEIRSVRFQGDSGIATGDSGLVAFTSDGGANWQVRSGLGFGSIRLLDARANTVVVSDGSRVAMSLDGGSAFAEIKLPSQGKAKHALFALHVATDGSVWLAGSAGTLFHLTADGKSIVKVGTAPTKPPSFVRIFEVGSQIYVAGPSGELWRGAGENRFARIETVLGLPIQAMTGEGDMVFAVTSPGRKSSNYLLRSDDAGEHFRLVGQMSHGGAVHDFSLSGGKLHYRDRVSDDFGGSWTQAVENYWGHAVDLADGSGKKITNIASYYGEDDLLIVGEKRGDWWLVDAPFNKGASFVCKQETGCWMIAGGAVYRPG